MIHYTDDWLTVLLGDCREQMAELPAESVHCVVTSPPYWGLRDYGTANWIDGDPDCDHKPEFRPRSERPNTTGAGIGKTGYKGQEPKFGEVCGKCGARRIDSQIGLEPTPEAYVEAMVGVFREVKRVLRSDGTLWLNIGDSYNSAGSMGISSNVSLPQRGMGYIKAEVRSLKHKDLVGIPWRLAFALQADGWYLRSDIIWAKPNPMPESVTDRPTKAHEYLFLLTKSPRYYYDADAVREPHAYDWTANAEAMNRLARNGGWKAQADKTTADTLQDQGRSRATFPPPNPAGRNLRTVWNIATQPYPGAHFATFPEALVEPCIKAGTSERGVCPECGAPWVRELARGELVADADARIEQWDRGKNGGGTGGAKAEALRAGGFVPNHRRETTTTGWRRGCGHESDPVPATCCDPFAGSGTVGRVANRLSRRAILIDLSAEYLDQAMLRNKQSPLGLGA